MVEIKGKWPPSQNTFCPKVERFFCFLTKTIFSVEKPLFSGADSGGKNGLVL